MTDENLGSRRVLLVASNSATSPTTGWPIGFWWSELVHPYWEFAQAGFAIDIASPDGGPVTADAWSDPRDPSGYSADDILSLGFLTSPRHAALLDDTPSLADLDPGDYAAVLFAGGQGPMVTFVDNADVHRTLAAFYDSGAPTAVVCHATCALLTASRADGELVVAGRRWTGFANAEEDLADAAAGIAIQPFRIEDRARGIADTEFIVGPAFQPFAVRDGNLITGQQQHSGAAAARLVIEFLEQS
jgi:putative intracellular protease/amidase